jgi:hypothetical protein
MLPAVARVRNTHSEDVELLSVVLQIWSIAANCNKNYTKSIKSIFDDKRLCCRHFSNYTEIAPLDASLTRS